MATKVRGITIELGADTSGISKALTGVNKEIGSTQKQLKDVERLLKLDPKNTELLEQKQRLLGNAVSQTESKLEALAKAQSEVAERLKETGEGQEQYDALTREIASCEIELTNLKAKAEETQSAMSRIGEVAGSIANATGNMASKTKALSAGAAGVLGTLGGMAVKAGQAADDLNTMSKQTGISTEELQKMRYAADLIDVPVDTITGSLKKLKKNMTSTSKDTQAAWEQLGVTLKDDVTGEFRNIDDVFYDTVKGLSEIDNETERDVVAMQLFGKSADELAGIIDDGGEALKRLGEEAKNKGVIISQEDLDSANEMNDAIDKLKAEAMGTFAQIGVEVAQMLLPYIPQIQAALEKVLDVLRNLDPDKLQFAVKIVALIAALSPLLSILSTLFTVIETLSPVFSVLGAAIGAISAPVAIAVAAIVAFVALIATKGDEIQKIIQKIDDFLQNIFAKDFKEIFGPVLGEYLNTFMKNVKNMWDSAKKIFDGIIDFIRGVFTGDWERAWNGVKEIFSGIFDSFVAIAKAPINGVIGIINSLLSGINSITTKVNDKLGKDFPVFNTIPLLANGGVVSSGSAIVGEAGAELLNVNNGVATVQPLTSGGNSGHTDITDLLSTYLPYLAEGTQLVLDSGVLVGATAPQMNDALGKIAVRARTR